MSVARLLLSAQVVAFVGGTFHWSAINQCPQPTEFNPDPPELVYAHPEYCSYYYLCNQGLPKLMQCKPYGRTKFSEYFHTCVRSYSVYDTCTRVNAQRECKRGRTELIGHPTQCHRYYNCSQPPSINLTGLGDYEAECLYPFLFDIEMRNCVPPTKAICGLKRIPPKGPCNYAGINCKGPNCLPCFSIPPSCVEYEDGFHPHPGREWTKSYISCFKEKLVETLLCGQHEETHTEAFFSPIKKKCVSRWEVPRSTGFGAAPSCEGKQLGVYVTAERKDVYYSCPAENVFYCEPGTEFNKGNYLCEKNA